MNVPMIDPWLVLRTKSRHEQTVDNVLQQKCIDSYLPKRKVERIWQGRKRIVELPLFPGYVFVRPRPEQYDGIRYIRGACGLILGDCKPATLPEKDLEAVKLLVDSGIVLTVDAQLLPGQRVRVAAGPLLGVEGELVSMKSQSLLVINVEMLCSSVRVEIGREAIVLCD